MNIAASAADNRATLATYDVVWDRPSDGSFDAMFIGNGAIGANVWVEAATGDVLFYVARGDAWSHDNRLLKLARVRVSFGCNLAAEQFVQHLHLHDAEITVALGAHATLRLWIDAHQPAIRIEVDAATALPLTVTIERWRVAERSITGTELHSAFGLEGAPRAIVETADLVAAFSAEGGEHAIGVLHRNESSCWSESLTHQGLAAEIQRLSDPLLHRTFGVAIGGGALRRRDGDTLVAAAAHTHTFAVVALTRQPITAAAWTTAAAETLRTALTIDIEAARAAHCAWWHAFWARSWIHVSGDADALLVSRAYALQRFVAACAGRGAFAIKFNGSLFTADWRNKEGSPQQGEVNFDADYRRWGGCYWMQNTRLAYWPMLASGDLDLLQPFFAMYQAMLPLASARCRTYFGHDGAMLPETVTFWGAYEHATYGWNRAGMPPAKIPSQWLAYHFNGMIELLFLAVERARYHADEAFVRATVVPLANAFLGFFAVHFPRVDGVICFTPAQALENWPEVVNPSPDIAGLHAVIDGLAELPSAWLPADKLASWLRLRSELPPLPIGGSGSERKILPAQHLIGNRQNSETPELYPLYPFRRFGIGKPDLEVALNTYRAREVKDGGGWRQHAVFSALLGLADEARDFVVGNCRAVYPKSRFPVCWGPNFDWIPDQDHGAVVLIALQAMVMQAETGRIDLLPAWPKNWNVDWRLHAPGDRVVEGRFADGTWQRLTITPRAPATVVKHR